MNEMKETRKSVDRSPAYPIIDLEAAITRARVIYEREGKNPVHVTTVLSDWGFPEGQRGGKGYRTVSALLKFGLLQSERLGSKGHRKVALTRRALSVILEPREDSSDRMQAVREAALTPKIHQAMWEKYGSSLPSDIELRKWLITEKDFSESGAKSFIKEYRNTARYAKLGEGTEEAEKPEESSPPIPPQPQPRANGSRDSALRQTDSAIPQADLKPGNHRDLQIPLVGKTAEVRLPYPMTQAEWDLMVSILNAMKPGLVTGLESEED